MDFGILFWTEDDSGFYQIGPLTITKTLKHFYDKILETAQSRLSLFYLTLGLNLGLGLRLVNKSPPYRKCTLLAANIH